MISDSQLPPPAAEPQSPLVPAPAAGAAPTIEPNAVATKPASKATNREMNDRVHQVAMMLARRIAKFKIKRFLREKFGIRARQAEVYLQRSRAYLLDRSQRNRDEIFAEIFASYESMIASPEADDRVRLEALKAMREMFGMDAPRKISATSPNGEQSAPLATFNVDRLSVEQQRFLLGIVMEIEAPAAGGQVALPEAVNSAA